MRYALLILAIAGLSGLGGCRDASQALDGRDPLRVMTYNIRYNNPGDGPSAWPERRDEVAALIRFVDPDVLGLQEALRGQIDDLERLLPDYAWIGVGRNDGADDGEFTPIFYRRDRIDVSESGTFWLSETPDVVGSKGWDAALPRIATWISASRRGEAGRAEEFIFVNTHFDHIGQAARRNSATLIADTVAAMANDRMSIVVGDFNADPQSEPYQVMASRFDDAREVAADNFGSSNTFYGFLVADTAGVSIDHIFVDRGVVVVRTAVLSEQQGGRYLSDHLPVVADVRPE